MTRPARKSVTTAPTASPPSVPDPIVAVTRRAQPARAVRYDGSAAARVALVELEARIFFGPDPAAKVMCWDLDGWRQLNLGEWVVREEQPGWEHRYAKAHPVVADAPAGATPRCATCGQVVHHAVTVRPVDPATFALIYTTDV